MYPLATPGPFSVCHGDSQNNYSFRSSVVRGKEANCGGRLIAPLIFINHAEQKGQLQDFELLVRLRTTPPEASSVTRSLLEIQNPNLTRSRSHQHSLGKY